MPPTDKKILVVTDEFPALSSSNRFLRRFFFVLSEHQSNWLKSRYSNLDAEILCSELVALRLKEGGFQKVKDSAYLGRSPQKNYRNLDIFKKHNEAVVSILTSNLEEKDRYLPAALSYSFISPHSEDVPFLISGVVEYLRQNSFTEIHFIGRSKRLNYIFNILADLKYIPVVKRYYPWGILSNFVLFLNNNISRTVWRFSFIKTILITNFSGGFKTSQENLIWLIAVKKRTLAYWRNLIPKLDERGLNHQIVTPSSLLSSLTLIERLSVVFDLLKLRRVWKTSLQPILNLRHEFLGVPISLIHVSEIKKAWFSRGLVALQYQKALRHLFKHYKPALIISPDPTELGQMTTLIAKEEGIRTCLYASYDDGFETTRAIWESHFVADNLLTLNSNQFSHHEKVVVGNTAYVEPTEVEKNKLKEALSREFDLDFQKPLILLLSRHISAALPYKEKQWLFQTVFRAAEAVHAQILIKSHPNENIEITKSQMTEWSCLAPVVGEKYSLLSLCSISDIVCNIPASSSGMDALFVGTPVINLNQNTEPCNFNDVRGEIRNNTYAEFGAALEAHTFEDCLSFFKQILDDTSFRQQLIHEGWHYYERLYGPRYGKSLELMSEQISAMVLSN